MKKKTKKSIYRIIKLFFVFFILSVVYFVFNKYQNLETNQKNEFNSSVKKIEVKKFLSFFKEELKKINIKIENDKKEIEYKIYFSSITDKKNPNIVSFQGKRELNFVYESLVSFDDFFQIEPNLAVSWGMMSDTEWKFNLRKNIVFHNGTKFDADSVIKSFEHIKNNPETRDTLKTLIKKIKSIEKINKYSIKFTTSEKVPTFLSDITDFFILENNIAANGKIEKAIGTGPYRIISRNKQEISLERFEKHWDDKKYFPKKLILKKAKNKFERGYLLLGDVSEKNIALADIPQESITSLKNTKKVDFTEILGVQSFFLIFNFQSDIFRKKENRMAFSQSLNKDEIVNIFLQNAGILVNQFVGPGIFGFNPKIKDQEYNPELIKNINKKEIRDIRIVLTKENTKLGVFLKKEFQKSDIKIIITALPTNDFIDAWKNLDGDIFFFGYDFSKGYSDEFFKEIVLNEKNENKNYTNAEVIKKINNLLLETDEKNRLIMSQAAMKNLTDDFFGIPLYANKNFLATISDDYKLKLRPDGILHF